jgi:uncharacterized protein YdeI (YjbR/CyaY-like superfamily)
MSPDPRVDAYIARHAEFARPILEHLRRVVHEAAPEAAETIKWGMPHFTVSGRILAGMAAFKAHTTFSLPGVRTPGSNEPAMGHFGRLTRIADLPPDEELIALVRQAAEAAAAGPRPRAKASPKPAAETPADLRAALDAVPAAAAAFEAFPPGGRRDYVDWIEEAKRPETRARRIAQAVEWMAEGKRRNWKYERC